MAFIARCIPAITLFPAEMLEPMTGIELPLHG
jgi:hypothetical protein